MRISPTELPEVLLVEPTVHHDDRGYFLETWHAERYADAGLSASFVQDNHSRSSRATLRGLHAQIGKPQAKLVRVTFGEIFDVAVDLRVGSPTFGRSVGVRLSAENFRQLFVPEGFAHGFCVLSEAAEVQYKCTAFYAPEAELTIAWNDPRLGIAWPVDEPLLSAKDRMGRRLDELGEDELPRYPRAAHSAQ